MKAVPFRITAPSLWWAGVVPTLLVLLAGCQSPTPSVPVSPPAAAAEVAPPASASHYVFGWGENAALAKPRGGTTRGAPATLAPAQALPLPAVAAAPDALARDRAAILALAGDYRVSFHFMETLGLTSDFQPAEIYHSWATEQVRVLEDTGTFVSLQHTLVMFFQQPDGTTSEPMVMKHWRQDWTYEPAELHTYRGDSTWERWRPTAAESAGAWSQFVSQVDDAPRYAALGRWEHQGNLSVWTGSRELRPLPRRELTKRKDYAVMEGQHRIVLTSTGWLHEQQNWKRVAGEAGGEPRYLAGELGLDRYERISSPELAPAADAYWSKTGPYWALVRKVWRDTLAETDRFTLRDKVDGARLFEKHFAAAEKSTDPLSDAAETEREIRATILSFLQREP